MTTHSFCIHVDLTIGRVDVLITSMDYGEGPRFSVGFTRSNGDPELGDDTYFEPRVLADLSRAVKAADWCVKSLTDQVSATVAMRALQRLGVTPPASLNKGG
ncbi:MAG: hypothetical protein RLN60_03480 [Phycisphaerales bacterium]